MSQSDFPAALLKLPKVEEVELVDVELEDGTRVTLTADECEPLEEKKT